jgi:hypothetical protein
MTAHSTDTKAMTFAAIIREIRDRADGDKTKAVAIISRRMRTDAAFREVAAPIIWAQGAKTVLDDDKRRENSAIFATHSNAPPPCNPRRIPRDGSHLGLIAEANERMMMDLELSSGVRLGDAYIPDIDRQIKYHHDFKVGNAIKELFYIEIRQRMKPNKPLHSVIGETEVRELWRGIGGDDELEAA